MTPCTQRIFAFQTAKEYSRDLANCRGNIKDFEFNILSEATKYKHEEIIGEDLKKMGLNLLYNVGIGSNIEPRLSIIKYEPNPGKPFIALIGKGILFDAGGYNIKSSVSSMH